MVSWKTRNPEFRRNFSESVFFNYKGFLVFIHRRFYEYFPNISKDTPKSFRRVPKLNRKVSYFFFFYFKCFPAAKILRRFYEYFPKISEDTPKIFRRVPKRGRGRGVIQFFLFKMIVRHRRISENLTNISEDSLFRLFFFIRHTLKFS